MVKVTAVVRERQFMGNSLTSGHICCGGEFCISEAVIPVKLKRSPTLHYPNLQCSHLDEMSAAFEDKVDLNEF